MPSPKIAKVVVDLPAQGPFDYAISEDIQSQITIGCRVSILFANRKMVGFVVGLQQTSAFKKLNSILSILDVDPVLDANILQLTKQFSEYYGCSWGEAIATYLPPVLRKSKKCHSEHSEGSHIEILRYGVLQDDNKKKDNILFLLHDKGSQKKWVFLLKKIEEVIHAQEQVIFLVPDITFMVKIKNRLQSIVNIKLSVLDKKIATQKNLSQWLDIKSGQVNVVLGMRSAVFVPTPQLGLIVVYDEEHDFYKQEQTPHYHVRQVAQMRAKIEGCEVCFVSAAPSAEIWKEAQKKNWQKVTFESEQTAAIQLVDMTNYNPQKTSILSFPLQSKIKECLESKQRVVLFMNRRGFASLTRCNQCGFTIKCERCDVNLTYLSVKNCMVCRHCNFSCALPKVCPSCKGNYMRSMGKGVEKLRQEASRLYPEARVAFFDKDTPSFPAHADIIIATQSIIRMKEQVNFDLIAVLNFDSELHHMNFRSAHKAFALWVHLYQMTTKKFVVQTYMSDNYVIKSGLKMDFEKFYRHELKHRKELEFPPYKHLVLVITRGLNEQEVFDCSKRLFDRLNEEVSGEIEVSDPHPDVQPKLRDKYRFSILLKGNSVTAILKFLKSKLKGFRKKKGIIITIDVDY
ncbi:hypothetical protein MNBD_UNCLBAC01-345 [hydrothermal vent metagenome]|uniref:Helicase PriA essential for oriC/DnaA-independent DNA replication n=1 Tax=hydrothermal vent metagenome TaxID=652676 RepID=A0A3B1D6X2_9ZZZZ